nr:MAG TPA: hypothetical protein [Bacteriophage sp.]
MQFDNLDSKLLVEHPTLILLEGLAEHLVEQHHHSKISLQIS